LDRNVHPLPHASLIKDDRIRFIEQFVALFAYPLMRQQAASSRICGRCLSPKIALNAVEETKREQHREHAFLNQEQ